MAFVNDRICKSCHTRYTLPTPVWAGFVFILIGLPLAWFGAFCIKARLVSGEPAGVFAMVIEGALGFVGLLAVLHGLRVFVRPGKV